MYKLYYSPGACSMAIHTILEEIGAQYTLDNRSTKEGKNRTPEFLKINPRGAVPVLEEDGKIIREGAAQIVYLCDKHKSPLLPSEGFARAEALEWLMFCNSTLHPAYSKGFWLQNKATDVPGRETLQKLTVEGINKLWAEVESHLATRPYLAGENITAGDILLTVIANWSGGMPGTVTIGPKTKELLARVSRRPAFQKALSTEQVEYKMAS
jgi:glutathione S-transferase